ncbi:uncharacterized protein LOC107264452 [Cephus cinctus]|uniref:Uncharacterized protein LOC107264452 n=1 Tax=Cephus cinctus TaxID=211228 RepID=A0AAJ7RAW3_CEPCN|nr:uncharacterized protein LOC107264452 [Cephus cinctus]XP_024937511.1 uncharacterized protein LOC107264452 [Cephus cinctus]
MHTENDLEGKAEGDPETSVTSATNRSSILEEDLALSSSTICNSDKSPTEGMAARLAAREANRIIYVNEDAMDCNYGETTGMSRVVEEPCSPELFNSDTEESPKETETTETGRTLNDEMSTSVIQPTQAEVLAKSDYCLLARINKHLSGVPPPPKHTICQKDCNDFLNYIKQNRSFFWTYTPLADKNTHVVYAPINKSPEESRVNHIETIYQRQAKSTSRNLSTAFDACDISTEPVITTKESCIQDGTDVSSISTPVDSGETIVKSKSLVKDSFGLDDLGGSDCGVSSSSTISTLIRTEPEIPENEVKKATSCNILDERSLLLYNTVNEQDVVNLSWDEAFHHKYHGIHYNRSKSVEEFETLTAKLCERYVGAETQSTCNIWFTKQAPGSARKRLLGKRNIGQSPGKRLSHLARRRRTFSSANLQGMMHADKKQLVLNVKRSTLRKGKSPRGKSPRGKSPRGSVKNRAASRRVSTDGPSPRRSKLETSKRALFQSPSTDRAGPSRLCTTSNSNPQKIKRALFPTPKKKEEENTDVFKRLTFEETRKRKNEDDLEGPRLKWAKSLSFDCPHDIENESITFLDNERHSTGSIRTKSDSASRQAICELSDAHKKKLLWAVAQALKSKGIDMRHPRFKQYASTLARTVKKFMPDLENRNIPRKPGSTSDRMLKLAKHHVLLVMENSKVADN